MDTNDFNTGQTIFLLSFLAAEPPSGLISKKIGPDRWIPFIITAWSLVSAAQAGLTNKAGYFACRCLLGLLMGGFIPDTVLYITYWYKKTELPIRLSWFWTVLSTCNILGSLLAAGILQMRGLQGWSGWHIVDCTDSDDQGSSSLKELSLPALASRRGSLCLRVSAKRKAGFVARMDGSTNVRRPSWSIGSFETIPQRVT
jgi:MFS family permease